MDRIFETSFKVSNILASTSLDQCRCVQFYHWRRSFFMQCLEICIKVGKGLQRPLKEHFLYLLSKLYLLALTQNLALNIGISMNKPIECLLHRDRALLAEYANVCLESLPDKHLQNLYVRQSKGTGWRALSSTQSTESKISTLLWVLWLLGSTLSCSQRISRKNRFCRCWSSTYRGLHKGRSICVKVWRGEGLVLPSQEWTGFFRKLEREVLAWQVLSHPNIGAVHGLLFTLNNLPSVVTPYYPNGDINSYVSNNPCIDLKALVLGVATGLQFLHHLDPPISHGDVRGCNVFITDDGVPVLSEIGLSLLPTPPDWMIPSDDGTCWMAPEVMDPRSISSSNFDCLTTPMSDVYSFGMTMLEVYTSKVPFYTRRFYGQVVLDIMQGMRPPRPKVEACASLTDEIWHTIQSCWAQDPLQRPTTESITSWLQLIIRSESAEYLRSDLSLKLKV